MRLQYARLKVEHGWVRRLISLSPRLVLIIPFQQRQNLNEVENLYFHHSHRGMKIHHPQPSLVTVPSDDNSASLSSSNQLHVAYKTSMPRSATLDAVLDSSGQMTGMGTEGFPARTPTPPGLLPPTGVGSHDPSVTASSTAPEVPASHLRERSHTPNQSSNLIASFISLSETISPAGSPSQGSISTAVANPTPQRSHLSTPSSTGKVSFSRTISPPTPGSVNQVKVPLSMHMNVSSLAKHDRFSSNKHATLTYDSFWSGLQSKSYPALTNGGSGTNAGSVNHQLLNNVVNTAATPLGALSTQSFAPNLASSTASPPPLPLVPPHLHHPSTPSSIPSSHTTTALPSASTQAPLLLSQTASFAPPPQTQQLQLQMQQNRPLIDNLAVWNLIASQPYPGLMNTQQGFNMDQLAGSTAVYPFLANLSATYAQAFNGTAEVQRSRSQGNEIGVSGNTPTPHGVGVPPSNTSASSSPVPPVPPVPPVASAFVGQEGS